MVSKTESLMLERSHRKILRTIQGLPIRCPSVALTSLLGSRDISSFISQQQLTFINFITSMSTTDLPRLIIEQRLSNPSLSGIIPRWQQLVDNLNLPSFQQLISTPRGKASWKNSSKRLLNINHYSQTSNNGPSEKWTTSVQRTAHLPPIDFTIELIHFEPPRSRHLSTPNNGH